MSEAKPDLPEAQTEPYLCGMARNVVREWTRERQRNLRLAASNVRQDFELSPYLILHREQSLDRLEKALLQLTAKQRQAIDLSADRGISLAEAARLQGLSEAALRDRLCQARKVLIGLLGSASSDPMEWL